MNFLKQSTSATVVLGPFVDSTDGATAETALTISQADIRLSKNGGAFAQTNNATGATHMENGYYSIPLDTTDTNTLGRLTVAVSESGALPVYREYHVVSANVWDSLIGATDNLQVDTTQVGGTSQTANDMSGDVDTLLTRIIGTLAAGTHNPQGGDSYARLGAPAGASVSADVAAVKADSAAILVDTGTSGVVIPQAEADKVWGTTTRSLTDKADFALSAASRAAVVDEVWDEDVDTTHQTAGTAGKKLDDAGAAADPWATAVPGAYGAGTAGYVVGTNINATVSSRSSHSAADVWAVGTRALTDKAGFSLSAAGIQAIWDALTSALTTVGSVGKKLADWAVGVVNTNNDKTGYSISGTKTTLDALNDLSAAQVNAEVDAALDTAVPGVPTEGSINERVKAIDDKLPTGTISDFDEAANQVTVATNNDKTGYSIGAGGIPVGGFAAGAVNDAAIAADAETAIANAVRALVVESQGSITLQQAISIILSAVAGVTSASGATLMSPDGVATRIAATINASNERTAMTLTPSS